MQTPEADRRPLERTPQLAATFGKFVAADLRAKILFYASGIIGLGLES
jgi:hypothetical protein